MKKKSDKHAFWQALVIAGVIFWTGIMVGIMFEDSRTGKLEDFYFNSETDIFDVQLQGHVIDMFNFNCEIGLRENINFAEKIYAEARTLEKYDSSNRITDEIVDLHKRYDLLRTMLWRDAILLQERCEGRTNVVVYLYDYVDTDVNKRAVQGAFSNVLLDLKKKHGEKVLLIPIAHDTGVGSLDLFLERYDLREFPVVVINQEDVVSELKSVEELEKFLNL